MNELVELRFVDNGSGQLILQYRSVQPQADASGSVCGFGDWGEWQNVPTVHVSPENAHLVDTFPSRGVVNR